MTDQWKQKEVWTRRGEGFVVEVVHHTVDPFVLSSGDRGHRWNVYAYIYPSHMIFAEIEAGAIEAGYPNAIHKFTLHWGPSFFEIHRRREGDITSFQFGSDYNHIHDEFFTQIGTRDRAREVFDDAAILFHELAEMVSPSRELAPLTDTTS